VRRSGFKLRGSGVRGSRFGVRGLVAQVKIPEAQKTWL